MSASLALCVCDLVYSNDDDILCVMIMRMLVGKCKEIENDMRNHGCDA